MTGNSEYFNFLHPWTVPSQSETYPRDPQRALRPGLRVFRHELLGVDPDAAPVLLHLEERVACAGLTAQDSFVPSRVYALLKFP